MRYVTFDESGNLTGAFLQDLHPDHADSYLEVDEEVYAGWVNYRLVEGELELVPPAEPAPVVPQSVGPYQARAALLAADLLDDVEALIADPETDRAIKIAWEYASEFKRESPFIEQMAGALGLTEQQVDELFIAAAQVE